MAFKDIEPERSELHFGHAHVALFALSRVSSITARPTLAEKERFAMLAASRGMSESTLALIAIRSLLDCNDVTETKGASSGGRGETTKDDGERGVSEIIERERRNLQRACALLDCLRIASMYDDEEEIDAGDVAYVVRGLVSDSVNALDRVELRRATRQQPSEPP